MMFAFVCFIRFHGADSHYPSHPTHSSHARKQFVTTRLLTGTNRPSLHARSKPHRPSICYCYWDKLTQPPTYGTTETVQPPATCHLPYAYRPASV